MTSPSVLYPRTRPQKPRFVQAATCRRTCPNGCECCLNANIPHTLHICHDPTCPCHSALRYATPHQDR